jgi:cell division protein FtsB
MRRIPRILYLAGLPAALVVAAGCQRGIPRDVQARLSQVDSLTSQRDSLFTEVANNARLMNEITTELNKVHGLKESQTTAESPVSGARENLVYKVQQVTERLTTTERHLAATRRQLRLASAKADSLSARTTQMEQQIADFEAMVQSQKTTIATLSDRVSALEAQTVALRDTVDTLQTQNNTAYYVIGTKKDLIERGIVQEQGGHRILFIFGKAGQTLVPARQLDPSDFTRIDIRQVRDIPLPDSTAQYTVASRQDLAYLATPPSVNGKVQGSIEITEPQRFWEPSKFLIVVRG